MKLVWVCWDEVPRSRGARRRALLDEAAPDLLTLGLHGLTVCVADEAADVPSPSPFPLFAQAPTALVNTWVAAAEDAGAVAARLEQAGFRVAGYRVDESIYADYGDNRHAEPRDWPDGERSPGVTAVSLLERPRGMSRKTWIARWHGRMSPVSEGIQPRTRYVRNLVLEALTPGAPAIEGIVEEAWPSPRHVTDPFLFYGAVDVVDLVRNMLRILAAVHSFTWVWRVQTFMASEWFVRTPDQAKPKRER